MSKPYSPEQTNRTPWTDYAELVTVVETEDGEGYRTATETSREVCCTFASGVSRAEYYEAAKAGQRVSASIEIWEDDYDSERLVDFEGKRYEAGRITPTGRGTLLIYLSEVWR